MRMVWNLFPAEIWPGSFFLPGRVRVRGGNYPILLGPLLHKSPFRVSLQSHPANRCPVQIWILRGRGSTRSALGSQGLCLCTRILEGGELQPHLQDLRADRTLNSEGKPSEDRKQSSKNLSFTAWDCTDPPTFPVL